MRRRIPFLLIVLVAVGATGAVTAATAPVAPAADLSVLDLLRAVPVPQPDEDATTTPACQDQICHWVDATGGNPGHYNCATQTNSKCFPSEDAYECTNKVCRKPVTGTPTGAGGL